MQTIYDHVCVDCNTIYFSDTEQKTTERCYGCLLLAHHLKNNHPKTPPFQIPATDPEQIKKNNPKGAVLSDLVNYGKKWGWGATLSDGRTIYKSQILDFVSKKELEEFISTRKIKNFSI